MPADHNLPVNLKRAGCAIPQPKGKHIQHMATDHKPFNYKALSWTVGVHVVLLLVFALWKFGTPATAAPVIEPGMEVNLGTSNDGSGTDQPMDTDDPAPEVALNSRTSATEEAAGERAIEQSDDVDAPAVTPVKPVTKPRKPVPETPKPVVRTPPGPQQQATASNTPAAQTQKPKFVYQGSTGRGGNGATENRAGTGEGNTSGPGDRGVPHGTPGASNYTGSPGPGTGGISHSLGGRNIVTFPPKEAEFRQGGRVVVRVTVNRDGRIVNKEVVKITNPELRSIALRKVDLVKFNRSETAPTEQFGNITFVFKTRN
jgi:outer membrane biosynthesis protein TonB